MFMSPSSLIEALSPVHDAVLAKDSARLHTVLSTLPKDDIDATDGAGQTGLMLAVENSDAVCVKMLCEAGADASKPRTKAGTKPDDASPLLRAVGPRFNQDIVNTLLEHGADVNYRQSVDTGNDSDDSALWVALMYSQWNVARQLLQAGAVPVSPSSHFSRGLGNVTCLMLATGEGQSDLIEMMLLGGADPNELMTLHLNRPCSVSAMYWACASERPSLRTVRLLCEGGADVNAVFELSGWRRTALQLVCRNRAAADIVSTLVVAGANPFPAFDPDTKTCIEASGVVDVLLDSRPSVEEDFNA